MSALSRKNADAHAPGGTPGSGASAFDIPSGPGALVLLAAVGGYIGSATHLVPFLINRGVVDKYITPLITRIFSAAGLGTIGRGRLPSALLAAAAANTFILSAVGSVAAVGYSVGWRNKEPRRAGRAALSGLPARVCATHDNMVETFPIFAAAAVLAQSLGSTGQYDKELALAFFLKQIVFPLSYVLNYDAVRTPAHIIFVGTCVRLLTKIGFSV